MNSIVRQESAPSIEVIEKSDRLVVDSRLIAGDLGIDHLSFMKTIKRYEPHIEERFGVIRFEVQKPLEGSQGGRPEKFAWLDEDQSMFLMTLSRNTDRVVDCKANLVEAFSKARKMIPALVDDNQSLAMENENLRLRLALEQEKNKGKQLDNTMLQLHGDRVVLALRGQSDVIVEKETVITEVLDLQVGQSTKILSAEQLKKAVLERTGQKLKSMKVFSDALRKAGRDDLLIPVTRPQTYEYVQPDKLDEAIRVVYQDCRQKLIGE